MRTKILNVLKITILAVFLSLGLSYVYAWVGPTATPPGNNAAAPVNVGGAAQTKAGSLTAAGLISTGGLDVGQAGGAYTYITLRDDESPNGVKYIHANSNVVGFLSGAGSWLSYWDNLGNQQNVGSVNGYGGVNGWGAGNTPGVVGSAPLVGVSGKGTDATSGTGVVGQGGSSGMGTGVFGNGRIGVIGQGNVAVQGYGSAADFAAMNVGYMYPDGTLQKTAGSWKQCKGSNGAYIQSFTVPSGWTRAQCQAELNYFGAASSWYAVGCFSASGPTAGDFGSAGGGLPANNSCGWDIPPPPPPPSGGCFVAGTQIAMKDGSQKDIDKIKVGEEIVVYNEATGLNTASPVVEVLHHAPQKQTVYTLSLSNGKILQPNDIHPMYEVYSNAYIQMKDLYTKYTNGTKVALRDINGSIVTIKNITVAEQNIPVYNLHVQGFTSPSSPRLALPGNLTTAIGYGHNYYANGILVHNMKPIIP